MLSFIYFGKLLLMLYRQPIYIHVYPSDGKRYFFLNILKIWSGIVTLGLFRPGLAWDHLSIIVLLIPIHLTSTSNLKIYAVFLSGLDLFVEIIALDNLRKISIQGIEAHPNSLLFFKIHNSYSRGFEDITLFCLTCFFRIITTTIFSNHPTYIIFLSP